MQARLIRPGLLLVAALLHACYQPPADSDCTVLCAPTTLACPAGFLCAANGRCYLEGNPACGDVVADAPLEGSPDDLDADGISDVTDNCLGVSNSTQRDEDGDGRGDRCDVCIGVPDCPIGMPTCVQPDGDGDGVGDACDRTTARATTVVLKYGVDGGGPSTDWVTYGGSWGTSNYPADGTPEWFAVPPTPDANYLLGPLLTPVGVDVTVEVGFRAITTNPSSVVSLWTTLDANMNPPTSGLHCGPSVTGGLRFSLMQRAGVMENDVMTAPAQQALTATPYRMWAQIGSSALQCGELGPSSTATSVTAGPGANPRRIGLHAAMATVEFDYVIVYADPP